MHTSSYGTCLRLRQYLQESKFTSFDINTMPANKKHLSSPRQRILKITAGFIGGYAVMLSFHTVLTLVFPKGDVVATAIFSGYILWAILLLFAFLARNGWKIWGIYILLTLLFGIPYLLQ